MDMVNNEFKNANKVFLVGVNGLQIKRLALEVYNKVLWNDN